MAVHIRGSVAAIGQMRVVLRHPRRDRLAVDIVHDRGWLQLLFMNHCGRGRRESAPFRVSGTASALMRRDDRNERRRGCLNTPQKARTRCRRAGSDRRPEPSSPARCPRIPAVQTVVPVILHQEILAVAVASVQNRMSRASGKRLDVSPFPAYRVERGRTVLAHGQQEDPQRIVPADVLHHVAVFLVVDATRGARRDPRLPRPP